jgi:hypothetical protein
VPRERRPDRLRTEWRPTLWRDGPRAPYRRDDGSRVVERAPGAVPHREEKAAVGKDQSGGHDLKEVEL